MFTPQELLLSDEFEARYIETPIITFVLPSQEMTSGEGGTTTEEPELFTVSITLTNSNKYPEMQIVGTQLKGFFKNAFSPTIRFVKEDQSAILEFNSFRQTENIAGNIFFYRPDSRTSITENVIAVATGNRGTVFTQTYNIRIAQDMDIGRLQLISAVQSN